MLWHPEINGKKRVNQRLTASPGLQVKKGICTLDKVRQKIEQIWNNSKAAEHRWIQQAPYCGRLIPPKGARNHIQCDEYTSRCRDGNHDQHAINAHRLAG